MTEPNDARRLELIAAAQRQWIDALTDLGGRNTLLYYKDRRESQTIANLIAAMVARGRKALFVAEKRAAIDAVLSRLVGVNLGDLGPRYPARVSARLSAPEEITPELADQIRDELREFTRPGGFAMRPGSTPWFGAAIGTRAQAHEAIELAVTLSSRTLPQVAARLAAAAGELGLPDAGAFSYPERTRLTRVLALLHQAGQPGRGFRERRALRREASVLDALRPLLTTCPLNWHYRSRDERLVAFSNDRIYGGALTTFPGVARDDCLRHVVVAQDPGPGQESSVGAEVTEVVRLVLEHARTRPRESLGVIALGMRHAERIDAAVRIALSRAGSASLEVFFARTRPSRSSSRTWSGCRATSGTRSSCRSGTASTATGGCATSGARC